MRSDNSIHLATAAKRRHELTRAKAIAALHELDRAGAKITFESVADTAEVSRSWLYTQTDLRACCGKSQAAVEACCHGLRPGGGSSRRIINPIIAHLIMASLVSGSRS